MYVLLNVSTLIPDSAVLVEPLCLNEAEKDLFPFLFVSLNSGRP